MFKPFSNDELNSCLHNADETTLPKLYSSILDERYIPLSKQNNVYYPTQRTKEWFAARAKVKSSITGSRPSGWYFDIKCAETYKQHLSYVHLGVKQKFTPEAIKRMSYGSKFEDYAQKVFIEYMLQLNKNIYVYETGFQRNTEIPHLGSSPDGLISEWLSGIVIAEQPSHQYKGQKDYLVLYFDHENSIRTYVIHGNERIEFALEKGKLLDEETKQKCKRLRAPPLPIGWQKSSLEDSIVYGARFSVLEIKCPASKVYSSIPAYYLCQLMSEMATYNIDNCYFMCWHQKDGVERLRVWQLRFHEVFWKDFLKIVDLFRMKNSDGQRGISWVIFKEYWYQFKHKYGRVTAWENHCKPMFEPRKYCIERPYSNKNMTS